MTHKFHVQGGGYDCDNNSFSGKGGEWNSILSARIRRWIREQIQAGSPVGGREACVKISI